MGNIFEVYKKLSDCAIAIAPYQESDENITRFSDPGKTKNYFSAGLPIIITKVPGIALEINRTNAGIAIHYNKNEFINAVIKILNKENLMESRKNVLRLKRKYSWDKSFDRAIYLTTHLK